MKRKNFFITVLLPTLLIAGLASVAGAATLSLEPSSTEIPLGNTFTMAVTIDDPANLGGAALTIQYDSSVVLVVGGPGEFDTLDNFATTDIFHEQVNDDRETPGTPEQIYPIIGNDLGGKVLLSGAYVDPTTGAAPVYEGSQTLFTVKFQFVEGTEAGATADFTLMRSEILNQDAGWYDENNPDQPVEVPPLTGVNPAWNDPNNTDDDFYPISATFPELATTITATAASAFERGDVDGSGGPPNAIDALYILQFDVGNIGEDQLLAPADMDCSGEPPNAIDALYILQFDVGNIAEFPTCK